MRDATKLKKACAVISFLSLVVLIFSIILKNMFFVDPSAITKETRGAYSTLEIFIYASTGLFSAALLAYILKCFDYTTKKNDRLFEYFFSVWKLNNLITKLPPIISGDITPYVASQYKDFGEISDSWDTACRAREILHFSEKDTKLKDVIDSIQNDLRIIMDGVISNNNAIIHNNPSLAHGNSKMYAIEIVHPNSPNQQAFDRYIPFSQHEVLPLIATLEEFLTGKRTVDHVTPTYYDDL